MAGTSGVPILLTATQTVDLSQSPAIDRGTSTSAPRVDLMMVARPRGAAIDIGAYEF